MKLIIAGGRDHPPFTDKDYLWLDGIVDGIGVTEIVSGCAKGADTEGEIYAGTRGLPIKKFPALWNVYGNAAGPIRNEKMAEYADAVALFPGGKGTANMKWWAEEFELQIFIR